MSQSTRNSGRNQDQLSGSGIVCIQHSQMEQLLTSLEKLSILEDIKQEIVLLNQKLGNTTSIPTIHEQLNDFGENITTLTDCVKPYMQHIQEERLQKEKDTQIKEYKKKIKKIWSDTLNKRKLAYFNMLTSRGTAEQYASFLTRDIPFFPKKFRPNKVNGESEEESKLKLDLARNKVDTEIGILRIKAKKHEEKVQSLDSKILEEITKCEDSSIREALKDLWAIDISKEEEISLEKWKKKETWLTSLPERKEEEEENFQGEDANKKNKNRNKNKGNNRSNGSGQGPPKGPNGGNQGPSGRPNGNNRGSGRGPNSNNGNNASPPGGANGNHQGSNRSNQRPQTQKDQRQGQRGGGQGQQTGGQRANNGNKNAGSINNQGNRNSRSYADIARDRQKGPQHTTKYNGQSSASQIRRTKNNNFLDQRPQQGKNRWKNKQGK